MLFEKTAFAMAVAGLVMSTSVAFAQAGGPDTPSDAKAQGTMENGASSTGMSKGSAMKHKMKTSKKKHRM